MVYKDIKEITDFPDKWKFVLLTIKTKEDLRDQLQSFSHFNWSNLITKLTLEIGNLLMGLPDDIRDQYLIIRKRDKYRKKWAEALADNNKEAQEFWLSKYRSVFDSYEGDKYERRTDNNG